MFQALTELAIDRFFVLFVENTCPITTKRTDDVFIKLPAAKIYTLE